LAPSNRNAARRYADRSRRRRPGRVTRTIDSPIGAESTSVPDAPIEQHQAESSTPVIQHRAGETRITISSRSRVGATPRQSTFETTDYGYVIGDLRRVTIVAGSLVVILLILSLVIH
jgi:hypothetical protein